MNAPFTPTRRGFLGASSLTLGFALPFGKAAEAVKAAWIAIDVPQCGFCQSGQVMSAIGLLSAKPKPTDADIDAAMNGNLCRCATYLRIRQAIHRAAELKAQGRVTDAGAGTK